MKLVNFHAYLKEVLKNATYELGESSNVIVAEAPDLPGCFTQEETFEEARESLIDAIELWVVVALSKGEMLPVVNDCVLAIGKEADVSIKSELVYG
ncbi:MAG: type II toxin-antitoxin system HicB family antitoxin [bacterium]